MFSVPPLRAPLEGRDRYFIVGIGLALSVLEIVAAHIATPDFTLGAGYGRDFVNFWLGGRLALQDRLDLLTATGDYNLLINQMFDHEGDLFVFSYPPLILPMLVPFGALPFQVGLVAWTALNILGLGLAVRQFRGGRFVLAAACLSPAAAIMVLFGHFGGIFAAMATFALRCANRRPALSGLCVAAMSIKPQFAGLLGIILLLAGHWRWLLTAVPATLLLAGASVAAFGVEPWRDFIAYTMPFQAELMTDFQFKSVRTAISAYAGLRRMGLDNVPAQVLQYGLSAILLLRAGQLLRRSDGSARSLTPILMVLVASQPYVNHYDLAIVAPAMAMALFGGKEGDRPYLPEIPALVLWVTPLLAMLVALERLPIAAVALTGFTIFLAFRDDRREDAVRSQAA